MTREAVLFFGRPFVKRFALCCRTVACPVLSVTLVYRGQTVGWIWMPLSMEVSLGPCDIVLDGTQLPQKGTQSLPPIFGTFLLWPNGRMDQDATWYGGRPLPRPHCVRWGLSSIPPRKQGHSSPHFSAHVYFGQTVAHRSNCWALVQLVMVRFRLYWVDSALPGIRAVRLDGSEQTVMMHANGETFLDVTVYQVRPTLCTAFIRQSNPFTSTWVRSCLTVRLNHPEN